MDSYEATKVVFSRIQSLDPQNASKIMGLLLIQDQPHNQMIRLAFGPVNLLHSLVLKARQHLSTFSPWLGVGSSFLDDPTNSGSAWKPCLYYAKGFCKNGPSCNFVHHASPGGAANLMRGARIDSGRGDLNPASRQIYLTFPAESTFREEDVSNYFSIYGAVEDVRIPYQQKRMFGFVTFVYSETVKFILAKGNPHFVCDSQVLVKPYKDKPKFPDNFSNSPNAIELQSRRLMDLKLVDVKRNHHHHHRSMSTGAPIRSPAHSPNGFFHQPLLGSDPSSPDASDENSASPPLNNAFQQAFNVVTHNEKDNNNNLLESLDLPDSPFASPTKGASKFVTTFTNHSEVENTSAWAKDSPLNSCYYFLSPRYSSSHGGLGM